VGEGYALDGSGFYVLFEAEGHSALSTKETLMILVLYAMSRVFVAAFADVVGAASVVLDEDVI
jgi:hypothetical protein